MKYFLDTEFIEGFHKPIFGKERHHIDLISIGIVAEDGREYYAISTEFKYDDADKWVKENVIHNLALKLKKNESIRDFRKRCKLNYNYEGKWYEGKSNKQISNEIYGFCLEGETRLPMGIGNPVEPVVEFYGYYSDYDWVLFCSLFGRMIDLPKGMPMHCIDLKQTMDEIVSKGFFPQTHCPKNFQESLGMFKLLKGYPKQADEHNALADAKWNYELYKFLNQQKLQTT